jgi:hypothetical protein
VIGSGVLGVDRKSAVKEVGDVHSESAGEQQQVGVARVGDGVLVPLDGAPLYSHAVGKLILG